MRVIALLVLIILQTHFKLYSQTKNDSVSFPEKYAIRANLMGLGLSAEYNFYKNFTIHNQVGIRWHLSFRDNYQKLVIPLFPMYTGQIKWYYNIERRLEKNKNINYFSGNYLSVQSRVSLGPRVVTISAPNLSAAYYVQNYIGLQYGLQRSFSKSKRWFWDFNIGYGLYFYPDSYPDSKISHGPDVYLGIGLRI
ncbi:MAG: hypothetical protein ACLGGV_00995 [Bacteroidia bacterium]